MPQATLMAWCKLHICDVGEAELRPHCAATIIMQVKVVWAELASRRASFSKMFSVSATPIATQPVMGKLQCMGPMACTEMSLPRKVGTTKLRVVPRSP